MHRRRIDLGRPVGDAQALGACFGRLVEQLLHLVDERAAVRRRHRDGQRAALVDRTGIDPIALRHRYRRRLAGHQALVDGRSAGDDLAVGGDPRTRLDQDGVADFDGPGRNVAHRSVGADAVRRLGLERGDIAGQRPRLAAHGEIERAAGQQEEEQHDGAVEIDVVRRDRRLVERHAKRQQHAERDRHVHVDAAALERAQRALEERLAGIGRGRQRDQRREPVEEVARGRRDVGGVARPYRHRQQHDVHCGEAGDGERADIALHLAGGVGFRRAHLVGPGRVAELVQPAEHGRGVDRPVLPVEADAPHGVIDAHAVEAGQVGEPLLDGGDAGGAVDAVDRQVEMAGAVRARLHVAADIERRRGLPAVLDRCLDGRTARRGHGTITRFFERKSCWPPLATSRLSSHTPPGTTACPR